MTSSIRALAAPLVVIGTAAVGYAFHGGLAPSFLGDAPPRQEAGLQRSDLPSGALTLVAEGLEVPWALAFLPDGGVLVAERPGRLVLLDGDERRRYDVPDVRQVGEGGLMGLAPHPDFESNRLIYVCLTAAGARGLENRVERYRLEGGLAERTVIIDGIPGARYHDGCRLSFGPDRLLYITTGDAGRSDAAQDRSSLAGKILRLTPEGDVPADNPFGTAVYSYGHRNPQGLTWDERGRLWSTEHGPSGGRSGFDELNLIEPGRNYGWPRIYGDGSAPGMQRPVLHAGADTWAPGGVAYWSGRVFFGGLRGESLYEARLAESGAPTLRRHFRGEFGRIRAVRMGPDGMLYFTTSNRDGRGRTRSGDDKIVRLDLRVFE